MWLIKKLEKRGNKKYNQLIITLLYKKMYCIFVLLFYIIIFVDIIYRCLKNARLLKNNAYFVQIIYSCLEKIRECLF